MSFKDLEILYQDQHYVAIHKPSGLLVHRSSLDAQNQLAALQILRDQLGTKIFPVHRLDRPTSGVLLFALSSMSAKFMAKKFETQEVGKTYRAIVRGHLTQGIDLHYPLREEMDRVSDANIQKIRPFQPAQTLFLPLATVELPYQVDRYPSARYSLIEAIPKTGRKHQLRRHLAHLRHPIVGDVNHGVGSHNRFFKEHFQINRLLLSCIQLSFQHPVTNVYTEIKAPLAPELQVLLKRLGWGEYV